MKSKIILLVITLVSLSMWSCEEYLDKVEASDLTKQDVFGTYSHFQGFQDQMYDYVVAYMNQNNNSSYNYGDHVIANSLGGMPSGYMDAGDYWKALNHKKTIFSKGGNSDYGIWNGGWEAIRVANICLAHIDELKDATDEQRELIQGQAYFLRAHFHFEIIRAFGGMPYIDTVLKPADDMKFARPSYQEATEEMVEDLDRAIELLPADWDETELGSLNPGANRGRATKGAAIALKAKALIYAGSPLMNNESTGNGYVYNTELLDRAAEAAHQFFKLVDQNYYSLVSLDDYHSIFYSKEGTVTFGPEIIWQRIHEPNKQGFRGYKNQGIGRLIMGGRLGQVQNCEAPTENLVELFEMQATGLPVDDPASGFDASTPWEGRDPRFYKSILTDGTKWVKSLPESDPQAYLQLYNEGLDRGAQGSMSGYMIKKYWPFGVNTIDQDFGNFWYRNPILRVAEIYLIYAEAVNEVYGPTTAPTFDGETGLTAVEAVNIIRNRAEMPDVHSKFTGDKVAFRERIRVERAVELCFEGQRWNDTRRWHVAHLPENTELHGLDFGPDHSTFSKVWLMDKVFDEKHYWMPLPTDQVLQYKEYYQNPGW